MIVGVCLAASIAVDLVFRHHGHAVFWWHAMPAFDLLFGLVGCLGLIVAAKWLGHTWLERPEDYYRDDTP
jgi:hypothetical protein